MGVCSDFVDFLRRERLTRIPLKKDRDAYTLALNLLRRYEAMLRMGLDPREARGRSRIQEALGAEIVRLYANKRMDQPLSEEELSRVSGISLNRISSMDPITREVCAIYYRLMATEKEHLKELIFM